MRQAVAPALVPWRSPGRLATDLREVRGSELGDARSGRGACADGAAPARARHFPLSFLCLSRGRALGQLASDRATSVGHWGKRERVQPTPSRKWRRARGWRAGGQQQQQQCFAYTGVRRGLSTLLTSPASTPPSDPSSSPALPAASASSIRRSRAAHVSACPAGCSSAAASRGVKCCMLPPPHLAAPTTACCAASMQPASMHHDAGIQRASIQRAQQTSSALSRAGKHQSASALSL